MTTGMNLASSSEHLWAGKSVPAEDFSAAALGQALGARSNPFPLALLLQCCDSMSRWLAAEASLETDPLRAAIVSELRASGLDSNETAALLAQVAAFLSWKELSRKVARELGPDRGFSDPATLARKDPRDPTLEAWAPLGLLVQVTPANSPALGFLSLVEGLLAGNLCFVKLSGADDLSSLHLARALIAQDPSGELAKRIFVSRFSSARKDCLAALLQAADGVAVWGSATAVAGVRALTPTTTRWIEWGPRISFILADPTPTQDELRKIAQEICQGEQQACSSPQAVHVLLPSAADPLPALRAFAHTLAPVLDSVSRETRVQPVPSEAERTEIRLVTELAREESLLGLTEVIEAEDRSWRLIVDTRPELRASPLFRTVWIKPVHEDELGPVLHPMRGLLQTVGLALGSSPQEESTPERWLRLSRALFSCGATRVRPVGRMTESYAGEPHDGEYALQRYSRRVSALPPDELPSFFSASEFQPSTPREWAHRPPILRKEEFQALPISEAESDLFFKSGGTSGTPKISAFSYTDYYTQMQAAAEGLVAAGLDPARDRVMNLFYAGGLYGSFVSFHTILENLRAVQLPMAAHLETDFVAQMIIHHRVNTLFGMPSYLLRLFEDQRELLGKHRGIRKIFFGGEHLSEVRRRYFEEAFGVELIRSAAYGSVDAGPLGFQCAHCLGGEHHLFSAIQSLEIVHPEKDEPVSGSEPGRLLFTPLARHAQKIERYEIGDMGRWVLPGPCPCGRTAPKFELLGRSGDVVRVGATFINYAKIEQILAQELGFAGELQMVIEPPVTRSGNERLLLRLAEVPGATLPPSTRVRDLLIDHYLEIKVAVTEEDFLDLAVEIRPSGTLEYSLSSGKLKKIIDLREEARKQ